MSRIYLIVFWENFCKKNVIHEIRWLRRHQTSVYRFGPSRGGTKKRESPPNYFVTICVASYIIVALQRIMWGAAEFKSLSLSSRTFRIFLADKFTGESALTGSPTTLRYVVLCNERNQVKALSKNIARRWWLYSYIPRSYRTPVKVRWIARFVVLYHAFRILTQP